MKDSKWLIFIIVGVVIVGGGLYLLLPGNQASPAENEIVGEVEPSEVITENPTETAQVTEVQSAEENTESASTQAIPPTPRTELESTDPNSVNLASGNVQLVELFAFW